MRIENIEKLINDFEQSLEKPHNYVRIIKQYLNTCLEIKMTVSFKTRYFFLENKSPVYKTALNKFFRFIGEETEIEVLELEKAEKLILDDSFYKDLSKSSRETYDNIIKNYQLKFGKIIDLEELSGYLNSIKNIDTHNITLSVLKRYFEQHGNVWVKIKQLKKDRITTNKGVFTELEISKMFLQVKNEKDLEKTCLVGLMMFAGLRSIDIVRLFKANEKFYSKIKGGRIVQIEIPSIIEDEINLFFKDKKRFGITDTSTIRKYCNELIIKVIGRRKDDLGNRYSTHSFRHSFAINHKKKGTDLERIRQLMHHISFDSTAYYAQIE